MISQPPDSHRITACMIDGATIAATAVERTDDGFRVLATEVVELPRLVETIERDHHPIHMDLSKIEYREPDTIQAIFDVIFAEEVFRNLVVGVFPPDGVTELTMTGAATPDDSSARRRTLLKRIQWSNPYRYPSLFSIQESAATEGISTTRVVEVRLDDFIHCASQFERLGTQFLGLVTGQRASSAFIQRLPEWTHNQPVTIIDVGKNRTLYSTRVPSGRTLYNSIPVGLARDDVHRFTAIPPSIELIAEMQDRIGGMILLPPEATPTPLFAARKSTPQIDATRFAIQIARFANRTLESAPAQLGYEETDPSGILYLIGRGARLPGLPSYLYSWTELDIYSFETAPLRDISLADGVVWPRISDSPTTLGAAIAWFERREDWFGQFLRERRIRRLQGNTLNAAELENDTLYVSEHSYRTID